MSRDADKVREELASLEREGVILPADVVAFAENPATALHQCFTWDDTEAAKQWRLQQARQIIRCYVVIEDKAPTEPVRAFVSLRTDRSTGGGYRKLTDVLSDEQLHNQLMKDALTDLKAAQRRYKQLTELSHVFHEVDKAEEEFNRRQSPDRAA